MRILLLIALLIPAPMQAQTARSTNPLAADVERLSAELNPQVVAWRRDFHQNPELGNRETRTAKVIADELRKLGFTVTTGVATTGVVGVLKGGLPVPGQFVFLGVTPRDQDHTTVPQNHSPLFFADESVLPVGVRVMTNLALDYLFGGK